MPKQEAKHHSACDDDTGLCDLGPYAARGAAACQTPHFDRLGAEGNDLLLLMPNELHAKDGRPCHGSNPQSQRHDQAVAVSRSGGRFSCRQREWNPGSLCLKQADYRTFHG